MVRKEAQTIYHHGLKSISENDRNSDSLARPLRVGDGVFESATVRKKTQGSSRESAGIEGDIG